MKKRKLISGCVLLAAFVLWSVLVSYVDVQPIGPLESKVGFAGLNGWVHEKTGVNMTLYTITDWLGIVPLAVVGGFAMLGLVQWIRSKNLLGMDHSVLLLGIFYVVVMGVFLLFEKVVVNYRPVLIQGRPEPSYPSSTTMLAMCVLPTAAMQLRRRIKNALVSRVVRLLIRMLLIFMVGGRLLSGVHWLTDIVGGALFSAGLVLLYSGFCDLIEVEEKCNQ